MKNSKDRKKYIIFKPIELAWKQFYNCQENSKIKERLDWIMRLVSLKNIMLNRKIRFVYHDTEIKIQICESVSYQ